MKTLTKTLILAAGVLGMASTGFAASSDSSAVAITIAPVLEIAEVEAMTPDGTDGKDSTAFCIASNDTAGYNVLIASSVATSYTLTSGNNDTAAYTVKFNGAGTTEGTAVTHNGTTGGVVNIATAQTSACVTNVDNSSLFIDITPELDTLKAGTYQDTLTLTLAAGASS